MDKTAVVSVERRRAHPLYRGIVRLSTKVQGARRAQRGAAGRRRPHRRDAAALQRQALADRQRRDPGTATRPARRHRSRPRKSASGAPEAHPRGQPHRGAEDRARLAERRRAVGRSKRAVADSRGEARPRRAGADDPGRFRLKVADNSGAAQIMCIQVLGGRQAATPASATSSSRRVKLAQPAAAVKKGDVVRAVVVRTAKTYGRPDGSLHPLRRQRGRGPVRQAEPAGHAHLRAGRARAARAQLHEDRLAGAGGVC